MSHPALRRTAPLLSLLALALAASCQQGPDLAVADDDFTMSADVDHAEACATIAVTELLTVRLPAQRGTGYSWRLLTPVDSSTPLGLVQTLGDEAPGAPEDVQIGGRTWFLASLVGQHPGRMDLEFIYVRPWEGNESPAKTYRMTVEVTKSQH